MAVAEAEFPVRGSGRDSTGTVISHRVAGDGADQRVRDTDLDYSIHYCYIETRELKRSPHVNGNMKQLKFKMPSKRTAWLIIIGIFGMAIVVLYLSLPVITKNVLVAQAEKFGLKNLQFRALHVGWRRLDLADVTLGDAAAPALRIPYLSVEYSLAGLWQKKIRNVRLVGASMKIEDRGQGFQFQGMTRPIGTAER